MGQRHFRRREESQRHLTGVLQSGKRNDRLRGLGVGINVYSPRGLPKDLRLAEPYSLRRNGAKNRIAAEFLHPLWIIRDIETTTYFENIEGKFRHRKNHRHFRRKLSDIRPDIDDGAVARSIRDGSREILSWEISVRL